MSTLLGTMPSIETELNLIFSELSPSKRQSLIDYAKFLYQNENVQEVDDHANGHLATTELKKGRVAGERPPINWVGVSSETLQRSKGCVAYEGDSLLDTEALYNYAQI